MSRTQKKILQRQPKGRVGGMNSQAALWKGVHRDPGLPARAVVAIKRLAEHIQTRSTQARLPIERAQELGLVDLSAADQWWARQQEYQGTRAEEGTDPELLQ